MKIPPNVKKEYEACWDGIVKKRFEAANMFGSRTDEISKEQYHNISCEINGGNCYRCGKPWKKIEAKIIIQFEYYVPACKCYKFCNNCGRPLWDHYDVKGKCPCCGLSIN